MLKGSNVQAQRIKLYHKDYFLLTIANIFYIRMSLAFVGQSQSRFLPCISSKHHQQKRNDDNRQPPLHFRSLGMATRRRPPPCFLLAVVRRASTAQKEPARCISTSSFSHERGSAAFSVWPDLAPVITEKSYDTFHSSDAGTGSR